jgi:hypothetical protein
MNSPGKHLSSFSGSATRCKLSYRFSPHLAEEEAIKVTATRVRARCCILQHDQPDVSEINRSTLNKVIRQIEKAFEKRDLGKRNKNK